MKGSFNPQRACDPKIENQCSKRTIAIDYLLVRFCYTYKSVPDSAIIQETTSCSGWELTPKHLELLLDKCRE